MKIAILGAGFAGLATAWHLLQLPQKPQITIFDEIGIGGGASGISAGLLHPFAGLHAKLNPFGFEGFEATKQLLALAETYLQKPVADYTGILRLALSEIQLKGYEECAAKFPQHVQWLSPSETQKIIPGIATAPGIFIPSGITVHSSDYLTGLWLACQQQGAHLEKKKIRSLEDLPNFDIIIATLGASCTDIPEFKTLPITKVKGQVLQLEWPQNIPPLPIALNSQIYCVMIPGNKYCLSGSTYERGFATTEPDVSIATREIIPKLEEIYPALQVAKIHDCFAGVRASTPDHLPFIKRIKDNCWVLTGFGSKGLLYHALYAKKLVDDISFGARSAFGVR